LDAKIASSRVGQRFRRLGRRSHEEVRALLAEADVWVGSAVEGADGDKEGIPTALLEAMAARLPVVTTDAGSILEVVEDQVSALIVPQKDPEALANALERVLSDAGLAQRLGSAAAERARTEFDVSVCETRFHAKLGELLVQCEPGRTFS